MGFSTRTAAPALQRGEGLRHVERRWGGHHDGVGAGRELVGRSTPGPGAGRPAPRCALVVREATATTGRPAAMAASPWITLIVPAPANASVVGAGDGWGSGPPRSEHARPYVGQRHRRGTADRRATPRPRPRTRRPPNSVAPPRSSRSTGTITDQAGDRRAGVVEHGGGHDPEVVDVLAGHDGEAVAAGAGRPRSRTWRASAGRRRRRRGGGPGSRISSTVSSGSWARMARPGRAEVHGQRALAGLEGTQRGLLRSGEQHHAVAVEDEDARATPRTFSRS